MLVSILFLKLSFEFTPYVLHVDNIVAETGHFQIYFTFTIALIIQNSILGDEWEIYLSVVLILLNCGVFFILIYFSFIKSNNEVNVVNGSGNTINSSNSISSNNDDNNLLNVINIDFIINRSNRKFTDVYEVHDEYDSSDSYDDVISNHDIFIRTIKNNNYNDNNDDDNNSINNNNNNIDDNNEFYIRQK
jgi:hypothetical protein